VELIPVYWDSNAFALKHRLLWLDKSCLVIVVTENTYENIITQVYAKENKMKPSFAIVGCGKVGTALGVFLARAGYPPAGFVSKSLSSAKHLADIVSSDHFSDIPWDITRCADVVFITTPDSVIEDTCSNISQKAGFADHTVVLHCSGALASTVLSRAKMCNAWIGSMHPLQSFASTDYRTNPFQGIIVSIEGEDPAVKIAKTIATDLGGTAVTLLTEAKTLYHASAVVASNYLVTLLDLAVQLIEEAGINRQDAFNLLKPLIEGTLSNIEKVGVRNALTGPIARGDVKTVKKHMEEIGFKRPDLLALYKLLASHTVDIAAAGNRVSESSIRELKKITD
jgi:predicted short-subunit dehydrogenase-like oxidoreductase (DUF2520 family)